MTALIDRTELDGQTSGDDILRQQGPDFLGIGMHKAGTGWLFDALGKVDGFEMLPVKEFHHFDDALGFGSKDASQHEVSLRRQLGSGRGGLSGAARRRLAGAVDNYVAGGFSDAGYLALFDANRAGLAGDITPAYSALNGDTVAAVHRLLPDIPVVLLLRHPVDRLWSGFNMHLRRASRKAGVLRGGRLQKKIAELGTPDALTRYLSIPGIRARSFPTRMHDAWMVYGDRLLVVGLDKIIRQPEQSVQELASALLGRKATLARGFAVPNRKGAQAKVSMTDAHRDMLFAEFADEIAECKDRFPEIAAGWRTQ